MAKTPAGAKRFKRLIWDIEVSPNVGLFWKPGFEVQIGHNAILQERKVICIAYSWEDEDKVTVLRWDKNQDDKEMLRKFLAISQEADELVAHYGDMFDVKWFRTRCLFHGFDPIPQWKTIDTKAWASRHFYFNSNKLDYISKFLGFGGKLDTDFQLWIDVCVKKSQKALDYMCKYCGVDVLKLKKVFKRLQGCVKPKTHVGVLQGGARFDCAFCGSGDVYKNRTWVSSSGSVSHQMKCKSCAKHYSITNSVYEDYVDNKYKKHKS